MWWGGAAARGCSPALAEPAWIPRAKLEFSSSSSPGRWFLGAEKKLLQWLGSWGWRLSSSSSFMNLALLYISLPCTVPRLVLGESCKNVEVKGNIVIVYCYLLLLPSLLWIFTTCICLVALNAHHLSNLHVQKVFLFLQLFFKSIVFPVGKENVCICSWVAWYFSLQVFFLSTYLCVYVHVRCLYCKCPTWKRAFFDSMHKSLAPCLSCASAHKQNRGTWYMIFTVSQSFEWVKILLLYRFCLCQCCSQACFLSLFFYVCLGVCGFCISFLLSSFFGC